MVPCAQLRFTCTRFPHSFRFPSASSSRHLSSFLCQTVAIWNRLPSFVISSTSLSLSLLFGQWFDATLCRICSAIVSLRSFLSFFSQASPFLFVFLCFCVNNFFCSLFSSSSFFVCVCTCVLLFHSPRRKAPD